MREFGRKEREELGIGSMMVVGWAVLMGFIVLFFSDPTGAPRPYDPSTWHLWVLVCFGPALAFYGAKAVYWFPEMCWKVRGEGEALTSSWREYWSRGQQGGL
jgi:hypothetical protein